MKIYKFFFVFLIFFSIQIKASVINKNISEKYDEIFSKKILFFEDILNYQKIFSLQEICEWKKANKYILLIKNKILLGHVLAQRYLHPRCYKSQFIELTYWLKKYKDHPQAKRIYRLAIIRMPKDYKSPSKPIKPIGIEKENLQSFSKKKTHKNKIK